VVSVHQHLTVQINLVKMQAPPGNLQLLVKNLGEHSLQFGVDATALGKSLGYFDLVLFYFPHTGVPNDSSVNVASNRELLRGFLASVPNVLADGAEVHVALKSCYHYDRWGFDALIREPGKSWAIFKTGKDLRDINITRTSTLHCTSNLLQSKYDIDTQTPNKLQTLYYE
jgi:hypothetical protein